MPVARTTTSPPETNDTGKRVRAFDRLRGNVEVLILAVPCLTPSQVTVQAHQVKKSQVQYRRIPSPEHGGWLLSLSGLSSNTEEYVYPIRRFTKVIRGRDAARRARDPTESPHILTCQPPPRRLEIIKPSQVKFLLSTQIQNSPPLVPGRVVGGLWSDRVGCDARCFPYGMLRLRESG